MRRRDRGPGEDKQNDAGEGGRNEPHGNILGSRRQCLGGRGRRQAATISSNKNNLSYSQYNILIILIVKLSSY